MIHPRARSSGRIDPTLGSMRTPLVMHVLFTNTVSPSVTNVVFYGIAALISFRDSSYIFPKSCHQNRSQFGTGQGILRHVLHSHHCPSCRQRTPRLKSRSKGEPTVAADDVLDLTLNRLKADSATRLALEVADGSRKRLEVQATAGVRAVVQRLAVCEPFISEGLNISMQQSLSAV